MRDVVVIGLDETNRERLASTTYANSCRFISLLDHDEVRGLDDFDINGLVETCEQRMAQQGIQPDGICTFWDFPVAELALVLAQRHGCPSTTLESLVKAHHKYWSRLLQAEVVPEAVPEFCAVDPFDPAAGEDIPLAFPFWLKPVRSFRSHLAFQVHDRRELADALEQVRAGIPRLAGPYDEILDQVSLPPEVAEVDGSWCIAEAPIGGRQCTVEGFVHDGTPVVYGIVDSVRAKNRSSFRRYEYPSRLPERVQRRMIDLTGKAVLAMGYDGAPFNVEFFWDRSTKKVWLLEINARQSQSHAYLFEQVDGVSNHEVMVALALGERPEMPTGQGEWGVAAKWFLRAWSDGVVRRVPTEAELAALHAELPTSEIHVDVAEGDRLGELPDQDSYSYELGVVYATASSNTQLLEDYKRLRAELPLKVKRFR